MIQDHVPESRPHHFGGRDFIPRGASAPQFGSSCGAKAPRGLKSALPDCIELFKGFAGDLFFKKLLARIVRRSLAGRGGINAEGIAVVRAGGTEGVFAGRQIPDG